MYSMSGQSWTWIGSIHGLDWIGSDDCILCFFFIYIFSILTTDKRWRCNTIMCILADFNRLWLDCDFYKTLRFRLLLFYDILSSSACLWTCTCSQYSSTVECMLFKCTDCWLADVQLTIGIAADNGLFFLHFLWVVVRETWLWCT